MEMARERAPVGYERFQVSHEEWMQWRSERAGWVCWPSSRALNISKDRGFTSLWAPVSKRRVALGDVVTAWP